MYEPQPNYATQPQYAAPAHVVGDRKADWRLIGAYIIAAFGVGAAVVCLYLLSSFKQVYASQMTKVNHAVTSAHQAQAKSGKDINGLTQKYDGMVPIVNAITAYSLICSQDLEGQNGPTRFYFACTDHKVGS